MTVNDLYQVLHYHWIYDESVFAVERQRIQLALIMLMMVYTTSRPGTIVECSGYRGSNQALCYENITLRLVRDPSNPVQQVLIMEVQLTLYKGQREKIQP